MLFRWHCRIAAAGPPYNVNIVSHVATNQSEYDCLNSTVFKFIGIKNQTNAAGLSIKSKAFGLHRTQRLHNVDLKVSDVTVFPKTVVSTVDRWYRSAYLDGLLSISSFMLIVFFLRYFSFNVCDLAACGRACVSF